MYIFQTYILPDWFSFCLCAFFFFPCRVYNRICLNCKQLWRQGCIYVRSQMLSQNREIKP